MFGSTLKYYQHRLLYHQNNKILNANTIDYHNLFEIVYISDPNQSP